MAGPELMKHFGASLSRNIAAMDPTWLTALIKSRCEPALIGREDSPLLRLPHGSASSCGCPREFWLCYTRMLHQSGAWQFHPGWGNDEGKGRPKSPGTTEGQSKVSADGREQTWPYTSTFHQKTTVHIWPELTMPSRSG